MKKLKLMELKWFMWWIGARVIFKFLGQHLF